MIEIVLPIAMSLLTEAYPARGGREVMSRVIVISLLCFFVILPITDLSADSGVQVSGIFSLTPGGYISFGDGTTQSTATLKGDMGPTGPREES